MKVLLDTHVFLWWITGNRSLSEQAKRLIGESETEVFFSAVSGWEIAIKAGLGRLSLPDNPAQFITDQLQLNSFTVLPVSLSHTLQTMKLPDHHRDPFDRLLVAQAQVESLPIVSGDQVLSQYPVEVIW